MLARNNKVLQQAHNLLEIIPSTRVKASPRRARDKKSQEQT